MWCLAPKPPPTSGLAVPGVCGTKPFNRLKPRFRLLSGLVSSLDHHKTPGPISGESLDSKLNHCFFAVFIIYYIYRGNGSYGLHDFIQLKRTCWVGFCWLLPFRVNNPTSLNIFRRLCSLRFVHPRCMTAGRCFFYRIIIVSTISLGLPLFCGWTMDVRIFSDGKISYAQPQYPSDWWTSQTTVFAYASQII